MELQNIAVQVLDGSETLAFYLDIRAILPPC
jgi:hypothetical protein